MIQQIKKIVSKNSNSFFFQKNAIREFIIFRLNFEEILFFKNENPKKEINDILNSLKKNLLSLQKFRKFEGDNRYKKNLKIKNLAKYNQPIFDDLWNRFDKQEYVKERIGRYKKRIKINNIEKLIKGKKIVDFGCGHGQFLISMKLLGAKKCVGVDYGKENIKFAHKMRNYFKFSKNEVDFKNTSIEHNKLKNNYFDFAIQNGVFHHLNNEDLAYRQVHKKLKKGGWFWIYTDGKGGVRDKIYDMVYDCMKHFKTKLVLNEIKDLGLNTNKQYILSDHFNVKYRRTKLDEFKKRLKMYGFSNIKQLKGGFKTDFDKPFSKDKFFKYKFGDGDLRLICQKI